MKIKTISVTYGRKLNLGDYNSAEIGVTLWADLDEGEDTLTALPMLFQEAKAAVKAQALPLIKDEKQIAAQVTHKFAGQTIAN